MYPYSVGLIKHPIKRIFKAWIRVALLQACHLLVCTLKGQIDKLLKFSQGMKCAKRTITAWLEITIPTKSIPAPHAVLLCSGSEVGWRAGISAVLQ